MISTSLSIPTLKKSADQLPTPSSSYCHSVASKDSKLSSLMTRPSDRMRSSSSMLQVPKQYGSFLSMPLSDDTLSFDEAPPTPPHTTVSPNDDDEGLYLLWTHQILREQGFRPSSCRTSSYRQEDGDYYDENEDDDDDESSQSESIVSASFPNYSQPLLLSTSSSPYSVTKQFNDYDSSKNNSLSSFTVFFTSCFCPSS